MTKRLLALILPCIALVSATSCEDVLLAPDDAATQIELVSGNGQSARVTGTLPAPIVVRLLDQSSDPVVGATVRFVPDTGSGTVNLATALTDAEGRASVNWTLGNTLGTKTLRVEAGASLSVVVTATVVPDRLEVVSGNNQATGATGELPAPIVVRLVDLTGTPTAGVTVTFEPTTGGGTVVPAVVSTGSDGTARTLWTLGSVIGPTTLRVSAASATSTLTFTATATQDTSRVVTIIAGNNNTGLVSRTLPSMTVEVRDRFNNLVVGDTIQWTDSLTNGITVSPTVSVTGADGRASTTPRLGVAVDSALVRARINGRSETVTFLATGQVAYSDVQTGNFFSCALTDEGRSYCWGYNRDRQLAKGGGVTADINRPSTPITAADSLRGPFQSFRRLSLGRTHACGVSVARKLICWGTGSGAFGATNPTEVNLGNTTVESVATGEAHSCYIDIDGFARCAGENALGQLGDNSTTSTTGNAAVGVVDVTLARLRFSKVAAGRSFTCGFRQVTDTLDATLRIPYCWGDNALGQLGRNTTTGATTAGAVVIPAGAPTAFDSTSIVTGLNHACALGADPIDPTKRDVAYCWGSNGYGQLGSATAATGSGARQLQMIPVTMPAGVTFVRLAAGEHHTCGLTATGSAYCWGRNSSGQLGNGTSSPFVSTPTRVVAPVGVTFQSISLGELHSCAVTGVPALTGTTTPSGTVYCWGDNEYGQIGDGTVSGNAAPVLAPRRVVNQP